MKSELSEEEKYRVAIQVDHFIEIIEKRSGMTFAEMMTLIQWVREHRLFVERMSTGTAWLLVTMVVSAVGYAVVEGMKRIFHAPPDL